MGTDRFLWSVPDFRKKRREKETCENSRPLVSGANSRRSFSRVFRSRLLVIFSQEDLTLPPVILYNFCNKGC